VELPTTSVVPTGGELLSKVCEAVHVLSRTLMGSPAKSSVQPVLFDVTLVSVWPSNENVNAVTSATAADPVAIRLNWVAPEASCAVSSGDVIEIVPVAGIAPDVCTQSNVTVAAQAPDDESMAPTASAASAASAASEVSFAETLMTHPFPGLMLRVSVYHKK
jgi:hypothetical protein